MVLVLLGRSTRVGTQFSRPGSFNHVLHVLFPWHKEQVAVSSPVAERLGLAPRTRLGREVAPVEALPGTSPLATRFKATEPLVGESLRGVRRRTSPDSETCVATVAVSSKSKESRKKYLGPDTSRRLGEPLAFVVERNG